MMAHDGTADKAPSLLDCCDQLRDFVLDAARNGLSFHDFEAGLWQRVLLLGHAATQDFLTQQGQGDLGPTLDLPDGRTLSRLEGLHDRDLMGVFGSFTLSRACYGSRQGQKIDFVPLDNRLQLPQGKFSYLLVDFDCLLSTEQPFAQVSAALRHVLRLTQHVDSLQRIGRRLAGHAEPFRQAIPSPAVEEQPILVRSADAKGVPMRLPADAPPIKSHAHKTGPKAGRKKQAIVGAAYTVAALVRTPEEVVEELFRDPGQAKPDRPRRPRPCNKRVLARLNEYTDEGAVEHDGMAEVFAWLHDQTRQRDPAGDKAVINLLDGDERLWGCAAGVSAEGDVDILELLHVTPKLWLAAGMLWPLASAEAEGQVRDWVLEVLKGQVKGVVADMRKKGQAAGLAGNRKKELVLACNYLEARADQMRYDEYLAAGYPIASGVIEGACRHYVKDRMERTGMSWTQRGAQAMLQLRAVALNGDWDDFQQFYRLRQSRELYPHRRLLEDLDWPLAV
jgi:hypothetical protein